MRRTLTALLTAAAVILLAGAPAAAGADPGPPARSCGALRLTSDLPAPPPGSAVTQSVRIDDHCHVVTGPIRYTPVAAEARRRAARPDTFHTYSQMYDCCGILMTALYTDSTATTSGGVVTSSETAVSTHNNREPWNAGWSVVSATSTGGCPAACAAATYAHQAELSYQGIFDVTGWWYHNEHRSAVVLAGDGTATCQQDVTLRHGFIGWHWEHGCA
jgi:hypothetical protein